MSVPFDLGKCVICQKNQKPHSLFFCKPCAKEWGIIKDGRQTPQSTWPEWIMVLVRDHDKWKKRVKSETWVEEVPYDPSVLTGLIESRQGS